MSLFIVDSLKTKTQILNFANSVFGNGHGSSLWINGRLEDDGHWYTNDRGNKSLWEGFGERKPEKPVTRQVEKFSYEVIELENQLENVDGDSKLSYYWNPSPAQKCLTVSSYGSFKITKDFCNLFMYPICEFKDPENVPMLPTTVQPRPEFNKLVPDPSVCSETLFFFLGDQKTRITKCLIQYRLSHESAVQVCHANGMTLYSLNSEFPSSIEDLSSLFYKYYFAQAWIDGSENEGNSSCTALVHNKLGETAFAVKDCNQTKWFICEF